MLSKLRHESARLVAEASGGQESAVLPTVEMGKVGDISCRYPFALAKDRGMSPAAIAGEIVKKIGKSDYFDKVEAAGPYINFYLSGLAYKMILEDVLSKKKGFGKGEGKSGKVLIEFPSVNPNKPWHIGHLRNAILGDSVARIMEFDGYQVERMDYIDDLGLQVAQSLWGVLSLGNEPEGKYDAWLGGQYVLVSKRFEEEPAVAEEVRRILKKMEEGDNEIAIKGRGLAEDCVKAQYRTSFDFGIYHDVLVFESDIMHTVFSEGVDFLKKSEAVMKETEGKNAGCWVVKLSEDFGFGKMENPDKVLIRSDGTAVYTGKDVIFHLWKFGKLENRFRYQAFIEQPNGVIAYKTSPEGEKKGFGGASQAINVIGVEQKYPQKVIVEVFRRLGFEKEAAALHHLSYEHVGLPEARFSGRRGTWVGYTADNLLAEARERVREKIKLDVTDAEKDAISLAVGAGAIKFTFLKTSSDKKITFRWEEALSLEGDSGPYAQYAYVRTKGILGKSADEPEAASTEFNDGEKKLLKELARFSDVVSRCSKELAPHHLTQYILDLAGQFSVFYANSPVIAEEDVALRKTRLAITLATSYVLENSLNLLGLDTPERM